MMARPPLAKDLVLLGGGHSHVEVLRMFGMHPVPGVRVTLVTRDMHTPYSGMLPGFISGFYSYDECHIDLCRLASFAKARLIHAEASGIDVKARKLLFASRPPLDYDVLSINVGITPSVGAVPGAQQHATAVKPIDKFAAKLDALLQRYRSQGRALSLVVVGGGAGGVEVALSLRYRLEQERRAMGMPDSCAAQVTLVCRGQVLESSTSGARAAMRRALQRQGVTVLEGDAAVSVEQGSVMLASGRKLQCDECIWSTGASAPSWLAGCGLPTNAQGFLSIGETLQCVTEGTDHDLDPDNKRQEGTGGSLSPKGLPGGPGSSGSVPSATTAEPIPSNSAAKAGTVGAAAAGSGAALSSVGGSGAALSSVGEVFAAGDVASCALHPRPKAGVYAVRQGPPLQRNLRAYLTGQPLERFVPQSSNMALITTGDRYCVGTKGWLSFEGNWVWSWKDHIDRTFMNKYGSDLALMEAKMMAAGGAQQQGAMALDAPPPSRPFWWPWAGTRSQPPGTTATAATTAHGSSNGQVDASSASLPLSSTARPSAYAALGREGLELLAAAKMRCGGCGAKVGSGVLSRVLSRLQQHPSTTSSFPDSATSFTSTSNPLSPSSIVVGLDSPDDAALVRPPPPGYLLVQTVDFFRSFWQDAYVFGRVAANHALGDCFAMGGTPRTALAIAVVPFAADDKMEGELTQLMAGALEVLQEAGCALVGGHTCEGDELALGFTINGDVREDQVLRKGGLRPGQALILTKALGTGTLMAAAMKGKTKGRWVLGALEAMQQSSAAAARIALAHGCTSCTDVTGFGLLGHLVEMARPSKVHVHLSMSSVPLLPGACESLGAGVLSSLHRHNVAALAAVSNADQLRGDARWPILVDPQTGGGLLMGVPAASAAACLKDLHAAGYADAALIGEVQQAAAGSSGPAPLHGVDGVVCVTVTDLSANTQA